jgi:hypothetical protein
MLAKFSKVSSQFFPLYLKYEKVAEIKHGYLSLQSAGYLHFVVPDL